MYNIGDRKSLDPLLILWVDLAFNQCYRDFISGEDIKTFRERSRNEGLPFLTQVLPSLGKALDNFHATGVWNAPDGFATHEHMIYMPMTGNQLVLRIPIFLGDPIIRALSGDSQAVDCIRQLSYVFYKLEVDYEPEVVDKFLVDFENVDRELTNIDWGAASTLVNLARLIIARILCNSDPLDIRPCHGSGSTACRTPNHDKWHKLRYYQKLDDYFSYPDYFFFSYTHLADEYSKLQEGVKSDPRARVVLVPKDSRGPRIISCEPAELMFIQQGLMRKLYQTMETHTLTQGHINFSDQSINRELARKSSITGEYATLDLSDASDRVSLELIRRIFPLRWVDALEACRSESTILPNGREVRFNKFAPMGSSCCFPIEALAFYALSLASTQTLVSIETRMFVYGDDIIVPTGVVDTVINGLESVGLKVNRNKSFMRGPFRESCGGDYHNGVDVTPVRVRKIPHASDSNLSTDTDLCNLFIAKFGYDTVRDLISNIESLYDCPFPRSEMPLPCCILTDAVISNDVFYRRRWNNDLQRYEHRVVQVYTPIKNRREPAWCELLRKELASRPTDSVTGKYENPLKLIEASLEPGCYADVHSAKQKWTWVWLG